MQRRDFLKAGAMVGASAGLHWSAPSWGATREGSGKLLVVMLRGAYDAASLLIPVSSDDYYAARPNIAISRPGLEQGAALRLDADWGLHPSAKAVHELYGKGQALFIPFSGNSSAPRSHFEAQDLMEAGLAPGSSLSSGSGWMGRFMERVGSSRSGFGAMAFAANVPLSLKGKVAVPNVSGKLDKPVDERSGEMMRKLYGGSALEEMANQGVQTRARVAKEMGGPDGAAAEMMAADRGARPAAAGLSSQFAAIAKVMRVDPMASVAFVDVGGWDTHVGQGGAHGQLAIKLGALSDALGAYASGMGPAWRDAVVMVMSEFGRTFKENGNKGTDHGHGTALWVLGGSIKGGRVAGAQERVSFANLNEARDFNVLNDYRGVAAEVLAGMYAMGASDLSYILPSAPKTNVGLF
jgi:uncharacterized protein (DUF1501 family)